MLGGGPEPPGLQSLLLGDLQSLEQLMFVRLLFEEGFFFLSKQNGQNGSIGDGSTPASIVASRSSL